jgi:hypothetical protein
MTIFSNNTEQEYDSTGVRIPEALLPNHITMLAYGSLLSEASARLTFPALKDFRYVRVHGLRRVFAHPHLFLIQEGLVTGMKMASLSAEYYTEGASSFVVAAFDVHLTQTQRLAFLERETSYEIAAVPYYDIDSTCGSTQALGTGVICLQGNDEDSHGLIRVLSDKIPYASIWNWPRDSGLLPADIYLRHCLLAVEKASDPRASESFRRDTFLADRETRLEDYLNNDDHRVYDDVMQCEPPPHLATRFGG